MFPAASYSQGHWDPGKRAVGGRGVLQRALWPFQAVPQKGPAGLPKTSGSPTATRSPSRDPGVTRRVTPPASSLQDVHMVTQLTQPHRTSWKSVTPPPTSLSLHLLRDHFSSTEPERGHMGELGKCRLVVRRAGLP